MMNVEKLIRERRSVRTFDGRELATEDLEKLCAFADSLENPYGLPIQLQFLNNMGCPVVVGTQFYMGAKMKRAPHLNEAFGYAFETLILYAQSLGIGTTWIGGTMDRGAFEKAMVLNAGEVMPCVSPLGYPASKMSLREIMMRKGIQADSRLPLEDIAFFGSFDKPMTEETAGRLFLPLEMVRLAPSAVNRQPWRMVVAEDMVHFYLKRFKGFNGGNLDMQKIDMGIALCHFDLMARELGIQTEFRIAQPDIESKEGLEYIASYRIK